MRRCITVLAVIILLTPHIFKSDFWCLHGTFGSLDYGSSGALRRRLKLGRGGPRAVRADVQRIHARVVKRLIGMLGFLGIMTTQGY
jgi:hypothetical protein